MSGLENVFKKSVSVSIRDFITVIRTYRYNFFVIVSLFEKNLPFPEFSPFSLCTKFSRNSLMPHTFVQYYNQKNSIMDVSTFVRYCLPLGNGMRICKTCHVARQFSHVRNHSIFNIYKNKNITLEFFLCYSV